MSAPPDPTSSVAVTTGGVPDALAEQLGRLLARTVQRRRHLRHGLLAVAAVDGSWQWQGAHGVADVGGTPITTSTPYPIASVTKLFTAVVIMRLQEQGLLHVTDRLVDRLPPEITTGLHVLDGVDRTSTITLEQLLSHTSGLADDYEDAGPKSQSFQDRLLAGQDITIPFDEVLRLARDELTPSFAPQPFDAATREAHYSNTNYALLGAIIEAVAGRPLHEVFASQVFDPLGLDDTSSYPHEPRSGPRPTRVASVSSKGTELQVDGLLRSSGPSGGIISTLSDQVRFMQGVVRGELFNDPATFLRMQQRFDRVFFPIDYGLGMMRYAPSRWMSPAYRIPVTIGHTGSTATWLWYCPELEVCVAGAFDVAQPPLPFRFVPKVLRAVQRSS